MAGKGERYSYGKEDLGTKAVVVIGVILGIVILGAIAVLLLSGPENGNGNELNQTNVTPPLNITNQTNITECDDQCLLENALSEMNVGLCTDISNQTLKEMCFEGLANDSLDACRRVENATLHDGCIVLHAERMQDPSVCDYLESGVRDCKVRIEECYKYEDTERKMCLMLKYGDAEYCGQDAQCLYNYSITSGDAEYCGQIGDDVMKYACLAIIRDQDECYILGMQSKKDLCRLMWAQGSGDKLTCTMLTPETVYSRDCHAYFAIQTHDPTFCRYANILQLDNLWKCYINYSYATGDPAGCDSINPLAKTNSFTCYFETAKKWGNPSICDLMESPADAVTCYVAAIIGNTMLDYRNCEGIVQVSWKNKCYTEYAKMSGENYYCEYITTENERNLCYGLLESG